MKKPVRARATDANALPIPVAPGDRPERVLAEIVADGVASNAYTVKTFGAGTFGPLSLRECIAALNASASRVDGGDLKHAEAMLMAQAAALNAIFGEMARRAAVNLGEHLDATERYMRLALKAQGQCRATLETLATIKNPPVVFARQANIAHGPQQVNNNGAPTVGHDSARAETSTIEQTRLLEGGEHEVAHCIGRRSAADPVAVGGPSASGEPTVRAHSGAVLGQEAWDRRAIVS